MKRIILSLAAAVLALAPAAKAQVRFGVVGGLNVSKISFDKDKYLDSENRSGWFAGPKVWLKVPLLGFGVNAAVEYNQRRLYGELKNSDGEASTSKYYKSIEIPVNVRYSVGAASVISGFLETGPQFGFTVGDKTPSEVIKFKSGNVTWNVGLGVRLVNHLEIAAAYNIALSNFGKVYVPSVSALTSSAKSDFKSNSWRVSAAYLF